MILITRRRLEKVLFYPLYVIFLALIKYFPRFQKIKIGVLNQKGRESLLISYLEPYLRQLGSDHDAVLSGVVMVDPTIDKKYSEQLLKMYSRRVRIIDRNNPILVFILQILHELLPNDSPNKIQLDNNITKNKVVWDNCNPSISFNKAEIEVASKIQKKYGINSGKEIICLGVRENSYYKYISKHQMGSEEDSNLGNETFVRNPNIETYIKALERLTSPDLIAFRMGLYLTEKINTNSKYVIDQANFNHNDLLDMYTFSKCKFVISGASGIQWFASLFNKPVLVADAYPFIGGGGARSNDIYIPRLVWSKSEKRLLSFSEIVKIGPKLNYQNFLNQNQLEIVSNTEDEIYEGCMEIINTIDNTHYEIDSEKATYLSKKLLKIKLSDNHMMNHYNGNISQSFLIKHEKLF